MRWIILGAVIALSGCDYGKDGSVTLYRNSSTDYSMRIHWATFDARDGVNYNLSNCQMAVRLLNANITALAANQGRTRDSGLGFWCEVGRFKETGTVPFSFREEYPSDAS